MSDVLAVLANKTRLKILKCLKGKEKSVTELVNICNLSQSALSQHLMKLRSVGLVKDKKEGRIIYYSLSDKKVARVSEAILNFIERK